MKAEIEITRTLDANISDVWKAITDKDLMKLWYFELSDFKAEPGFCFEFKGKTDEGVEYNHLCEVTEVEFEKKLTYSWKYEGYEGISFVSFLLTKDSNKTILHFKHRGLKSFPANNPDFAVHNFQGGWNYFINESLPHFLDSTTTNNINLHKKISVSAVIDANKSKVWDCYTQPEHIVNWNFADPSWHCPSASNDMTVGGKYLARMEARDGSFGFDFEAYYTRIDAGSSFSYEFGGRHCDVSFQENEGKTEITVTFDPESEHPADMQQQGWQAILNNFKSYVEAF